MPYFDKIRQLIVLIGIVTLLAAGCSSTPVTMTPSVEQPAVVSTSDLRDRLHQHYLDWRGVPYKVGGNDRRGIDCSGFVHLAYKNALGVQLPRSTDLLAQTGEDIPKKQLAVGDLVFFKTGFAKQHVGIYMGDGQFIHASTSRGVMKSTLKSPYWSKHYWKSTRVLSL